MKLKSLYPTLLMTMIGQYCRALLSKLPYQVTHRLDVAADGTSFLSSSVRVKRKRDDR